MTHVDLEGDVDTTIKRYAVVGKQMENVEVIVVNSITPNLVNFI